MIFLSIPLVMFFYMLGGQTLKWIRPVGVALSLFGVYGLLHHSTWYLGFPALFYGFELAFGYGTNSIFSKIDNHNDEETRILYGIWCCIPIVIACIFFHHWLRLLGMLLIVGAFQDRAGTWFKIGKYDFLEEDFWRSLAIATAMSWSLM